MAEEPGWGNAKDQQGPRRTFLGRLISVFMAGGLAAGYGLFAAYAVRFLFPASRALNGWQFVATVDQLPLGKTLAYEAPSGARIVVARQSEEDMAESFIALSSVCPHLGCAVHWEPQHDRFFCPCHNGAFDAAGKATAGPPAAAKQQLTRYPLKVERGLLFIEVPLGNVLGQREV